MKRSALGLVVAALFALPASASASFIVYDCGDGANLCRVDPATGAQTQLTTDGQPGTSNVYGGPSLARDGTKLAFVFNNHVIVGDANAGNRGAPFATTALVALMRPDGGEVSELELTFSTPAIQVCTYNLDGSGRNCPYGVPSAGWAPDNNLLISVGAGPPNYNDEIQHCPVGGGSCDTRASDPSNNLFDPAVSPDGSTLAVTVANGVNTSGQIALYNYATGQFERNLTNGTNDEHPAWSPDGSQIAFQRGSSIYLIGANATAGSEHQLVAQGAEPTWGGGSSGPGPGPGGAPNTKLSSSKVSRSQHKATFKFSASGSASGFQCALVKLVKHHKGPHYSSCHSPKTYKHLASAKYEFFVRAVGGSGDDPSPATHKFRI